MGARPVIRIERGRGPGALAVVPETFLGEDLFKLFRDSCRAAGGSYSKTDGNQVRPELMPELMKQLDGWAAAYLTPGARAILIEQADAIDAAREQATGRVLAAADRPYPFQVVGINTLVPRKSFILADQMRLGKTVQSLLAVQAGYGVLAVVPGFLRKSWAKAVRRWRPDLTPFLPDQCRWPLPGEVVIINYERLPMLNDELDRGKEPSANDTILADLLPGLVRPIYLIGDEVQYIKSSKSERTKRFRAIRKAVAGTGGWTWGLTGTPIKGNPMDLLNLLTAFGLLQESFGTFPNFLRLMNGRKGYFGGYEWKKPMPGAIDAIQRVMLRRLMVDVFPELPRIAYEDIEVEPNRTAKKANREAVEAMGAAGVDLRRVLAGEQGLGASAGTVFEARRILAESKIPAMLEIVENHVESQVPLIVFSAHRKPIQALIGLRGCSAITGDDVKPEDRLAMAQAFQDGKQTVIGLTIRSGNLGLELHRAAHILMVDEEWTPDENDQAVSRAMSTWMTNGILVRRLVIPGTIDEDVQSINHGKREIIRHTVDVAAGRSVSVDTAAMRAICNRVRPCSAGLEPKPARVISTPAANMSPVAPSPAVRPISRRLW